MTMMKMMIITYSSCVLGVHPLTIISTEACNAVTLTIKKLL